MPRTGAQDAADGGVGCAGGDARAYRGGMPTAPKRQQLIVQTLEEHFTELMTADPGAFRTKFRKMARDPFAFYRGSACVFYADMASRTMALADAIAVEA